MFEANVMITITTTCFINNLIIVASYITKLICHTYVDKALNYQMLKVLRKSDIFVTKFPPQLSTHLISADITGILKNFSQSIANY